MKKLILSIIIVITILTIGLFFYQNSQFKNSLESTINSVNKSDTYKIILNHHYKFPNSTVSKFELGYLGIDNTQKIPLEIEFKNNILNGVISLQTNFDEKKCMCENFKLPVEVKFSDPDNFLNFNNLYFKTDQTDINKQTGFGNIALINFVFDVIIKNYKSEYPETEIYTKIDGLSANSKLHNITFNMRNLETKSIISLFNDEDGDKYPYLKEEKTKLDELELSNLAMGVSIKDLKSSSKTEPYKNRIKTNYELSVEKIILPISNHFKSLSSFENLTFNIDNDVEIKTNSQFINFVQVQAPNLDKSPFFTTYILIDKLIDFNKGKQVKYNISSDSINDYSLHIEIETPNLTKRNDILKINKEDTYSFYIMIYKDMIDDINKLNQNDNFNHLISIIEKNKFGFIDEFGNFIINIKTENETLKIQTAPSSYQEYKEINLKELKKVLFEINKEYNKKTK